MPYMAHSVVLVYCVDLSILCLTHIAEGNHEDAVVIKDKPQLKGSTFAGKKSR